MKNLGTILLVFAIVLSTLIIVKAIDNNQFRGANQNFNVFSGGVANANVSITATASSTTILNRNLLRQYAQICNASSTDATNNTWIWFNTSTDSVVVNKGFTLAAGTCYEIDSTNLYLGAVQAISTAVTTTISTLEK